MKRFILTIMCVSVFFIGIGSIIEKTSAKFKSDAKALEIIQKARMAIGGDANLKAVESMSVVATTTNFFEKDGIQNTEQGGLEINMQLPNQFSKMVKFGDPANGNADKVKIIKDFEVVVEGGDGKELEFTSEDGTKKGIFVIKQGDSNGMTWKSDSQGKVRVDGDKLIITKDDGTTEEINIKDKKRIRVTKDANGNVLTEDIEEVDGNDSVFIVKGDDDNIISEEIKNIDGKKVIIVKDRSGNVLTEDIDELVSDVITEDIKNIDGKKVIIMKDSNGNITNEKIIGFPPMHFKKHGRMGGNEMLRTTISLLLTAPTGRDVTYKFAGMGNVDGNTSNIIDVSTGRSSFKLYIDASTNLPQMLSYEGHKNVFFMKKDGMKDMSQDEITEFKEKFRNAKSVEHQVKFSDFRNVGSLLLPHRWSESVNGKQSQTIDITSYEINPANIADKFGQQKMFVRKMKK